MRHQVNVVTLGCSKNLVDSEILMGRLQQAGFDAQVGDDRVSPGAIVVVNTCGFIADAKEESINTILELAEARGRGDIEALYVMGCLSQRYADDLPAEIPEVDGWFGKFSWDDVLSALTSRYGGKPGLPDVGHRHVTTGPRHAYLKISEGCDRFCAFCAIPLITGRHHSRPVEDIEAEVRVLVSRGVREFNVIAQDLSSYGLDIYGEHKLATLIDRIADIRGVEWIRLHYAYPADMPMDILDVMARRDNVCKYLDIALQHISDPVLSNMRRHISASETRGLLAEMRRRVPGLHLRTTLMVGFPGEGEAEFEELLEFVREQRFERMGAFAYSEEDDTWAARHLDDTISDDVKADRLDRLMALQQEIALDIQQQKVGSTLKVMIDREEEDYYVGRTQWDSPEVDPEVLVKKETGIEPGEFYDVCITGAFPFELVGEVRWR